MNEQLRRRRHRSGFSGKATRAWVACLALMLALPVHALAAAPVAQSPDGLPQRLVLALDGIPFDVFVDMQQRGYFADFNPAGRMVSTFPSLSEVAFAAIDGREPPPGYQHWHFDPVQNRLVGNTVSSLSGRVHPKIAADSSGDSVPHRVLGYMASSSMAMRDLRQIGREVLASRKSTFVGYLGTSDPVVHIHGREGAEQFLIRADGFLKQLQATVLQRTGRRLLIDIVSDHGSTLVKGRNVPVERLLANCGFQRRDSLQHPDDTAYPLPGIIGSIAIGVSRERAEDVASCLAQAEGVDLVAVDRGDAVGVLSADGHAQVRLADTALEAYEYRSLRGDPLHLLEDGEVVREFDQAQLFKASLDAPRPDPLRRLWRAFHGSVQHPTPVLVSLADGYEVGNPTLRTLSVLRGRAGTHGSMTRSASVGVIVSNWRQPGDASAWSANEVLFGAATLSAMAQTLAAPSLATHPPPARDALEQ